MQYHGLKLRCVPVAYRCTVTLKNEHFHGFLAVYFDYLDN